MARRHRHAGIPGVGPFIAAGPIVATLAGMGAGGAFGGTVGALIGLGIPEYQAKRYEGRMRKGGILLSVHTDDHDWASKGRQILEQTGAEDISSTGETKGDFANTDRPTARVEHDSSCSSPQGLKPGCAGARDGMSGANVFTIAQTSRRRTIDACRPCSEQWRLRGSPVRAITVGGRTSW